MTTNNLKRVLVFIASPGDVPDARSSVRYAVERINRLVAKDYGFELKPIGWEDIPPGRSQRAQEIINPYVDAASIFIGILHRRFGQPTGAAESGTEEEYDRIEKRWENEEPKPEVLIYFKKIPDEQLADPGEKLKKVLAFKKSIRTTTLYKDFEIERELIESVQDALHDWIVKNRNKYETPGEASSLVTLQPNDKEVLACVLKLSLSSIESINSQLSQSTSINELSIQRLQNFGLIVEEAQGMVKPINSMEGFLAIAKHLNTNAHYKTLLSSSYFQNMLNSSLGVHILNRFHCELPSEMVGGLQCVALLSSHATTYLLFGDTSIYDNIFDNMRDKDKNTKKLANGLMQSRLILCVLLEYGADYIQGNLLTEFKSKRLAGQLLSMNLKVAYEEAKAFEIQIGMPQICAYATSDFKAGEMAYGSPEFGVRQGTICMHLDLDKQALEMFDQALSKGIPDDAKVIALNNKGLIYLKHNRPLEAIPLFEQAIEIAPNQNELKQNLELANRKLSEQQEDIKP